jgi:hypothetical protein
MVDNLTKLEEVIFRVECVVDVDVDERRFFGAVKVALRDLVGADSPTFVFFWHDECDLVTQAPVRVYTFLMKWALHSTTDMGTLISALFSKAGFVLAGRNGQIRKRQWSTVFEPPVLFLERHASGEFAGAEFSSVDEILRLLDV